MTTRTSRGPFVHAEAVHRLTVTCIGSGTLESGMVIEDPPPPRQSRWSWRHPIRSLRASWARRHCPRSTGRYALVGQIEPSIFEIAPQHRDGCACIDCRNKVM